MKSINLLWVSFYFLRRQQINSIFTLSWEQTYTYVSLILKTKVTHPFVSFEQGHGNWKYITCLSPTFLHKEGTPILVAINKSGIASTGCKSFAFIAVDKIRSTRCLKKKNSFGVLKKINDEIIQTMFRSLTSANVTRCVWNRLWAPKNGNSK